MRMFSLAATLAVALLAVGPLAHASGGAGAQTVLEQSHAKVIALADADAKPDAIQREVDLLLDYGWIAQAALGGPSRYAERCAPRCDEFEALLTKLIRSSYTKRLSAKQRGEVEYLGEHVRDALPGRSQPRQLERGRRLVDQRRRHLARVQPEPDGEEAGEHDEDRQRDQVALHAAAAPRGSGCAARALSR